MRAWYRGSTASGYSGISSTSSGLAYFQSSICRSFAEMAVSPQRASLRSYLIGPLLALALTAIPCGLVAAPVLSFRMTLAVIAVTALAQIVVHLRFFLHLG